MPDTDGKLTVRAAMLARRKSVTLDDLRNQSGRIRRHLVERLNERGPHLVAAHCPMLTEPGGGQDIPLLPQILAEAGFSVVLPILEPDLDVNWGAYTGPQDLARARFGLWEPTGEHLGLEYVREVDAVVVPAVAVDQEGTRLGKGGGSYDRVLARVAKTTPVIALVFDEEFVDLLPSAAHDRPVTEVITPNRGWISVTSTGW